MPVQDELEQPSLATRLGALVKDPRALIEDPKRLVPFAAILLVLGVIGLFATGGSQSGSVTTGGSGSDSATGLEPGEAGENSELATGGTPGGPTSGRTSRRGGTNPGGGTKVGVDVPISETEMAVGILYVTNPGASNDAAGFTGSGEDDQLDQKKAWDLMVDEVNKKPPFGRKVKPVYFSTSEENAIAKGDALWEEMCAHWTQDNKVFLAWVAGPEPLRACMTKARVAQVGSGSGSSYEKTFKDYPWYIEHNSAALDRMSVFEVDQLWERGYFQSCRPDSKQELSCVDGKPRIALLRYQYPAHLAAAANMKKALASHGLALCDGCEFEATHSDLNLAEQLDDANEAESMILSCKSPHTANSSVPGTPPGPCTHVMFLGGSGCRLATFYAWRAEDQGYHPRLGLNSVDCATNMRDFARNNFRDDKYYNQFTASLLVGHDPGDFEIRPSGFQECKAVFEKGGFTFGGPGDEDNSKQDQIPGYCDTAWYHQAAFNAAGKDLDLNAWLNGVANTGLIKSAGALLMRTTATRHDGASAVRIGDWDAGGNCRCWKVVTGDVPV